MPIPPLESWHVEEVPPVPSALDGAVRRRINEALLATQCVDFATRGLAYALGHLARAMWGAMHQTYRQPPTSPPPGADRPKPA